MTTILVLGGGPDAEREVSIRSAAAIADALRPAEGFTVATETIDTPDLDALRALIRAHGADLVFPALHGPWGEGGPLQALLEALEIPFVGSGSRAAGIAMDKGKTKQFAAQIATSTPGVRVSSTHPLGAHQERPLDPPFVVKPNAEGSTVGLTIIRTDADWERHRQTILADSRNMIAEPFVQGREVTVSWLSSLGGRTPPIIEIVPSEGLYDYAAKYQRTDTRYVTNPELPKGLAVSLAAHTGRLCLTLGIRSLARADYLVDNDGNAWFLEINTMPGFTATSLVPKSCAALGIGMTQLCAGMCHEALFNAAPVRT